MASFVAFWAKKLIGLGLKAERESHNLEVLGTRLVHFGDDASEEERGED